jgi:hypothetical protein
MGVFKHDDITAGHIVPPKLLDCSQPSTLSSITIKHRNPHHHQSLETSTLHHPFTELHPSFFIDFLKGPPYILPLFTFAFENFDHNS